MISLVTEESLSYCLVGLRYSPFTYLTLICVYPLFDDLKSPIHKKYFSDLNLDEAVKSSVLVVQLKLRYC